jgi:hypothetical protein
MGLMQVFFITPFPAFVSANMTVDLASLFVPLLGTFANLKDGMDTDMEIAAPKIAEAFSSISGEKVERLMKKLLTDRKNISVTLENGDTERLTEDLANEIFSDRVAVEIERQLALLPRAEIARASIDQNGRVFVVRALVEAFEAANEIAPEHLELCVDDPFALLPLVKNAASVFLGRYCPEALGDYFAGPNHTLPTVSTARFASPSAWRTS